MNRILYTEVDRPANRWSFNQAVRQRHLGAIIPYDRDILTHDLLYDLFNLATEKLLIKPHTQLLIRKTRDFQLLRKSL